MRLRRGDAILAKPPVPGGAEGRWEFVCYTRGFHRKGSKGAGPRLALCRKRCRHGWVEHHFTLDQIRRAPE